MGAWTKAEGAGEQGEEMEKDGPRKGKKRKKKKTKEGMQMELTGRKERNCQIAK